MTYEEVILQTRSEKAILCIAEAVAEYKIFSVFSGSVYVKDMPHFVSKVKQGTTLLTAATSTSLSAGQYYFSPTEKKLYVRMTDSSNPKTKAIAVTHKLFFSDTPLILPFDLNNGAKVEFEPRINSIGALGQQLDEENTGVVLETSSSIDFINTDGYFDSLFDLLVWENQAIDFYSWFPNIAITEAKKIFSGVVESKDFSSDKVTFKVKDFINKLKNDVVLKFFSENDGNVLPSINGKPKRRIYGQADQVKCVGVDAVLDGYFLTGTIETTLGSKTVTGTSTLFLSELSPGDDVIVTVGDDEIKLSVDSVTSDTAFELGEEAEDTIAPTQAVVKPTIPYRFKNRIWNIAGHKLRAPIAEITDVISSNRFIVDDTTDFFAGDLIDINGDFTLIRRISGNTIVTNQAISPLPVATDLINKAPVSKVYFGSTELIVNRDWTLDNNGTNALIEIEPLAEFNVAPQRTFSVQLLWTNSSRTVTTTDGGDLRTIVKTRDWIRKDSLTEATWYEVLDVQEQSITLRIAFSGTTETIDSLYKNVTIIDDDALITVNCIGMEYMGSWIKTASDAAKHLIEYDSEFTNVNDASFAQARADSLHTLSMVIPESIGEKSPTIRETMTKINESVFGSLYINDQSEISYAVLNSRKPEILTPLKDDEILSWEVSSNQDIANEVIVSYRPFTDIFTGENGLKTTSFTSDFVNRVIGIKKTYSKTVYLYDESSAIIMAQRLALFKSLSNCKVSIKGKMSLNNVTVNDKIYLSLDRLYKRYGGADRLKIGSVIGVKKTGSDVDIEVIDLGNIFNRVPSIAPNTTMSYPATRDDVVRYGFIVDDDTLTPDNSNESEFGNNLIG